MKVQFKAWLCDIEWEKYGNGRVAILLVSNNEPIATATVNLPNEDLADDEVAIKDYSENTGMLSALVDAKIVKNTGRKVASGIVSIPICKLLV